MQAIANRRYSGWVLTLFGVLVIAQVVWWVWSFLGQANQIAELKTASLALASASHEPEDQRALYAIQSEVARRRTMFLSEAACFLLASCWALYMLHRTLRREERSQALQRRFMEMISHESKTPLTALKLRLEDLQESLREPRVAEEIEGALQEVSRLSAALNKVLSLNRSEQEVLKVQAVLLAPLVDSVLRRLASFLKSHHAEVRVDVQTLPETVAVLGDRGGIETSLQCLIENAVLHNPSSERQVWISVAKRGKNCGVQVRDNGPGIRTEDQTAIFERFARGSESAHIPGTGLGLYIARRIAEAHEGSLELIETSNAGSLFELQLPAVEA